MICIYIYIQYNYQYIVLWWHPKNTVGLKSNSFKSLLQDHNTSKAHQTQATQKISSCFPFSSGSVGQHESRKLSPKKVQYRLGTDTNSKTRPPHLQGGVLNAKEPTESRRLRRCQTSASQTLALSSVPIPLSITGPLFTDLIPRSEEWSQLHVDINIYIYIHLSVISILYIYIYIYIVYIYIYISFVLVQVIPFPPKKNRGFCWNPYKWLSTWVFSLCMTWNFFHFPQGLWHPKNFDLGHVFSHPAHSTGRPIWGSHPPAPVVVHRPASRWVFPWQSHQVARSKTCPTMAFHSIVGESWPYHHCIRSHPHNLVDVGWCGCDCWWICWVDLFFWKEVF